MGWEPWEDGTAGKKKDAGAWPYQQQKAGRAIRAQDFWKGGSSKECGLNLQPLKMDIFKMEEKKVRVFCNGGETRAVSLKDSTAFSLKV